MDEARIDRFSGLEDCEVVLCRSGRSGLGRRDRELVLRGRRARQARGGAHDALAGHPVRRVAAGRAAAPGRVGRARRRGGCLGGTDGVGHRPAGGSALPRQRPACLRRRLGGGSFPGQRLAHPGRDGRLLDAAAEDAGRPVVRGGRPVGRAGHPLHQRVRLRADAVAGHRRGEPYPHRVRAGRSPGRARRSHPPLARRSPDRGRRRRRALRVDAGLPVGLDHTERRRLQPAGHGRLRRPASGLLGGRHPARCERRAARLGRPGRVDPRADSARDRKRVPRPAGPAGHLPGRR